MGGKAFTSGPDPLFTPRMPPQLYKFVRDSCHEQLRQYFDAVQTPVEGPAKSDYGDVDIFIFTGQKWQQRTIFQPNVGAAVDLVQTSLGSVRTMNGGLGAVNMAIPWPTHLPDGVDDVNLDGDEAGKARHIQVDIHLFDTIEKFRWALFKNAHGDFWNIIGSFIKPLGLTINHDALYLRIPEVEKTSLIQSRVFLSSDPGQVLTFLGLDSTRWDPAFASDEAMFEYIATCRLFAFRLSDDGDASPIFSTAEMVLTADGRPIMRGKKLNKQRRACRAWSLDFLPKSFAQGRFQRPVLSRAKVCADAFGYFKDVEAQYKLQLLAWLATEQRRTFVEKVIEPVLPHEIEDATMIDIGGDDVDGQPDADYQKKQEKAELQRRARRGLVVSAFKRIILENDESYGIQMDGPTKDENGLLDVGRIQNFIVTRWKEVAEVAKQRSRARQLERIAQKAQKRASANHGAGDEEPPSKRMRPAGFMSTEGAFGMSEMT